MISRGMHHRIGFWGLEQTHSLADLCANAVQKETLAFCANPVCVSALEQERLNMSDIKICDPKNQIWKIKKLGRARRISDFRDGKRAPLISECPHCRHAAFVTTSYELLQP